MSNYEGKSDRGIHDRAIGKKHQSTGWIKKISIVFLSCVLALTLATPMLHADDLEIGPEIIPEAIGAPETDSTLNPTVTTPKVGANKVSGKGLQKDLKAQPKKVGTIHVLVKDADGAQKGKEKNLLEKPTVTLELGR